MNRHHFLSYLGLGAVALTATATLARRQGRSRPPRIVITKTNAYLIGKIEPVLTGKVTQVVPSPDGRYVLITQALHPEPTDEIKEPFGEEKLWLYDALRRTTKLFHRVQDEPTQTRQGLMALSWFPGTKRALVAQISMKMEPLAPERVPEMKSQLGICDVDRGTIRWLSGLPSLFASVREVKGISGFLVIWGPDEVSQSRVYCVLKPDGTFTPLAKIVSSASIRVSGVSLDKKRLFLRATNFEKVAERFVRQEKWSTLELSSGTIIPLTEAPKEKEMIANVEESAPKLALTLRSDAARVTGLAGRSADTNALWLEASELGPEKKFTRALVAAEADSQSVQLLRDLSAVLYTHDDALYAAPIASLDRVAFEKMMRELAISNAKQTGLGLMMYAQDYDENFPHDPSNVKEVIYPYIKNNDVIADFVYTYKGPLELSKVEKPAETAMGYIPSPGGRAVVYADGHVKWEPTPEK
ncbi:MAG: hypothetical protein NTX57_15755 [Armatimonadetes bacterium]|nr:hypothetical protein [Armatimonadota bacterium]